MPVVRRLTGGGAILHDLELTYSLALPINHPLVSSGAYSLYELAHDAVIACLGLLGCKARNCGVTDDSTPVRGPFFCFERRHAYDVLVGPEKIAGSAQRRTHKAVLQHGSIILGNRYAQQHTATPPLPYEEAVERVRASFCTHLAELSAERFEPGEWSTAELTAADLLTGKYAGDEWTKRT